MLATAFATDVRNARSTTTARAYESALGAPRPRAGTYGHVARAGAALGLDAAHGRRMPFDLDQLLRERHGEKFALHAEYLNPQLAKVLRTLGFDRLYVRGEGCYLYDDAGRRYLDLLAGFGVFALGRGHPAIKDALHQAIDVDLPNMVQIDCALLPGLLAEALVARSPAQLERVFFCNSGAEAVEAAIKFARAATKRARIVYCAHAYHGLTTGRALAQRAAGVQEGLRPAARRRDRGALRRPRRARRASCAAATSRRSSSSPSRARASTRLERERWREVEAAVPRRRGAVRHATRCRRASGAPGAFCCHEHSASTPTSSACPRRSRAATSRSARCSRATSILRSVYCSMDRAMVHSTTFKRNQLAMVAGLATLSAIDDERIVEHAAAMGDALEGAARAARSSATRCSTTSAARAR